MVSMQSVFETNDEKFVSVLGVQYFERLEKNNEDKGCCMILSDQQIYQRGEVQIGRGLFRKKIYETMIPLDQLKSISRGVRHYRISSILSFLLFVLTMSLFPRNPLGACFLSSIALELLFVNILRKKYDLIIETDHELYRCNLMYFRPHEFEAFQRLALQKRGELLNEVVEVKDFQYMKEAFIDYQHDLIKKTTS